MIYQQLYELVHQYIYGLVELSAHQDLVCTMVATTGSLLLIAFPFWLVIKITEKL